MSNARRRSHDDFLEAIAANDTNSLWLAIKDICVDYDGQTTFPQEIAYFFHEIACDVARGKTPEHIKKVVKRSKKSGWPKSEEIAVLYAKACEAGIVKNKSYARYIRDLFGIKERTWHKWREKHRDRKETDLNHFHPDLRAETRARFLEVLLQKSAEKYKQSK